MADVNAKVVAMVERALKKNPELRSTDLQERAVKIDKTLGKLNGRQFHARYALPARRRLFGVRRSKAATNGEKQGKVASAGQKSDPFIAMLTDRLEERKARLSEAVDGAFQRAIQADSVKKINELLSSIDRRTREFERG